MFWCRVLYVLYIRSFVINVSSLFVFDAIHERSLCRLLVAAGLLLLLALLRADPLPPRVLALPAPSSPPLTLNPTPLSSLSRPLSACLLACDSTFYFNKTSPVQHQISVKWQAVSCNKSQTRARELLRVEVVTSRLETSSSFDDRKQPRAGRKSRRGKESCDLGLAIEPGTRD